MLPLPSPSKQTQRAQAGGEKWKCGGERSFGRRDGKREGCIGHETRERKTMLREEKPGNLTRTTDDRPCEPDKVEWWEKTDNKRVSRAELFPSRAVKLESIGECRCSGPRCEVRRSYVPRRDFARNGVDSDGPRKGARKGAWIDNSRGHKCKHIRRKIEYRGGGRAEHRRSQKA